MSSDLQRRKKRVPARDYLKLLLERAKKLPLELKPVFAAALLDGDPSSQDVLRKLLRPNNKSTNSAPTAANACKGRTTETLDGKLFGPYRLGRAIGRGNFGTVYIGQHRWTRQRVAVKVLHEDVADDATARFDREIAVLKSLEHRNVVRIFRSGVSVDGRRWYAMELIADAHATLRASMAEFRRAGATAIAHLMLDVLHGLTAIHGQGVIHRDLNTGNIIIRRVRGRSRAIIIDFGLARALRGTPLYDGTITDPRLAMGTPDFMSPEQAAGEREITTATDVFSVGAIGWYLTTGRPPHALQAARPDEWAIEKRKDPDRFQPIDRRTDFAFEMILRRALAADPGKRFSSTSEFAGELRRWLDDRVARPNWKMSWSTITIALASVAISIWAFEDRIFGG